MGEGHWHKILLEPTWDHFALQTPFSQFSLPKWVPKGPQRPPRAPQNGSRSLKNKRSWRRKKDSNKQTIWTKNGFAGSFFWRGCGWLGCCWVVGWLSCFLFAGLLCCWVVCWVVGLLGCWVVGMLGCWDVGLLCCWLVGLLGCWVAATQQKGNQANKDRKNRKDDEDKKDNPTTHNPIDMTRRNARSD